MLLETFINNGVMPLAAEISAFDTEFTVTSGINGKDAFDSNYFARATLSVEGSSDVEVVYVTSMVPTTNRLKVIRGREQTTARAWPVGAVLECRVTAGMLSSLQKRTLFNEDNYGLSVAYGENIKFVNPDTRQTEVVRASWAIGGIPTISGVGGDWASMASSVEGLGASTVLQLGNAVDFDSSLTYFPGAVVRDPNPPHLKFSRTIWVRLGDPQPALEATPEDEWTPPWVAQVADEDGGLFRTNLDPSWYDPDVWFYPSEIGFICDQYSATSPPVVSVGEADADGVLVSKTNLVNAQALTGIDGAHQRMVLGSGYKHGVKGMIFFVDAPASGGSFKGYFYWKGIFLCSSTAAGWPAVHSMPDGRTN